MSALLLVTPSLMAQTGEIRHISVDTVQFVPLESDTLMPGVVYQKLYAASIPWTLDVVTVDLSIPGLEFTTLKADDRLRGYERTSSMVARAAEKMKDRAAEGAKDSARIITIAVNGDFYRSGGVPVNAQISEGELLNRPVDRTLFTVDDDGGFYIGETSYSGVVECADGRISIQEINSYVTGDAGSSDRAVGDGSQSDRAENQASPTGLFFFNRFYGADTTPHFWGAKADSSFLERSVNKYSEWSLKVLDGWAVNRGAMAVVQSGGGPGIAPGAATEIGRGSASSGVPGGGPGIAPLNDSLFALAYRGDTGELPCRLAIGDTVRVLHTFPDIAGNIISAVGGSRKILERGENRGNWPERHPRTAIGFNADTTQFTFVTVDGRQESSIGMTLTELAGFMRAMGVSDAINLDGGGSTTMVVNGRVMNRPSDKTGERTVSNALMAIIPTP